MHRHLHTRALPGLFQIMRTRITRTGRENTWSPTMAKKFVMDFHDGRQRLGQEQRKGVEAQFRAAQPVRLHKAYFFTTLYAICTSMHAQTYVYRTVQ